MNFKNIIENLIIIIGVMSVTAFVTHKATLNSALKTNELTNKALIPAIVEGIRKETTAINNNTSNSVEVKKLKARKNEALDVNFRSEQPTQNTLKTVRNHNEIVYKEGDTIQGLVLVKKERLTRRQKRRLNLLNN
jgi:ABC-type Na+ efflux pump permease subunit